MNLKSKIREIPDWPKPGIDFKDITPLLADADAFAYAIDKLCEPYLKQKVDLIVGIDARGFLLASAMAYKLKTGIAIVRKKGKLPYKTVGLNYNYEYATDTLEMHVDAIKPGHGIIIVDDVLATGNTIKTTVDLVQKLGGKIIGISFLINLEYLKGMEKINNHNINVLIHYDRE